MQATQIDYHRGGTQKDRYSAHEVVDVSCPLCGRTSGATVSTEHGALGIRRCDGCSLLYTSPRVREPERVYWGDHESYLAEARLIFSGERPHHRDPNYLEELGLIERHRPQRGRLLDVGCNMGMLLRLARERGWEAIGVEPSPALHRIATEQFALEVHNCFLADMPTATHDTFDVVALSDVFEHVTEPRALLRDASRLLKPDGLLYVKVPNVVHYTERTLRAMLDAGGFEPLEMTFAAPVQVPVWHEHVGHYFQYPSPWILDWRRHLARSAFHRLAHFERVLRGGRIGYLAQNLVAVAQRAA
jgi:SAM-dependent methyltransferase